MFWFIVSVILFLLLVYAAWAFGQAVDALGMLYFLIDEHVDPDTFKDGVTDPTGRIDLGSVYARMALTKAKLILLLAKKEGPWSSQSEPS